MNVPPNWGVAAVVVVVVVVAGTTFVVAVVVVVAVAVWVAVVVTVDGVVVFVQEGSIKAATSRKLKPNHKIFFFTYFLSLLFFPFSFSFSCLISSCQYSYLLLARVLTPVTIKIF